MRHFLGIESAIAIRFDFAARTHGASSEAIESVSRIQRKGFREYKRKVLLVAGFHNEV